MISRSEPLRRRNIRRGFHTVCLRGNAYSRRSAPQAPEKTDAGRRMEQFVTNKNRSFLLYGRGMPRPDCPIRFGNRRRESVVVTIVGDYQRIAPPIGESRLEYDFP